MAKELSKVSFFVFTKLPKRNTDNIKATEAKTFGVNTSTVKSISSNRKVTPQNKQRTNPKTPKPQNPKTPESHKTIE